MKKEKILIPFKNGELQNYPFRFYWGEGTQMQPDRDVEWLENYEFDSELELLDVERGRSAAHFIVSDTKTGKKFIMFMKDLFDICKHSKVEYGIIKGTFTFCKRGTNYGIKGVFKKSK